MSVPMILPGSSRMKDPFQSACQSQWKPRFDHRYDRLGFKATYWTLTLTYVGFDFRFWTSTSDTSSCPTAFWVRAFILGTIAKGSGRGSTSNQKSKWLGNEVWL